MNIATFRVATGMHPITAAHLNGNIARKRKTFVSGRARTDEQRPSGRLDCALRDFWYLWSVTRWKTVLSVLLAFYYPLAAGYCLIEMTGWVTPVDCCAETASHEHKEKEPCEGYRCCPIEYAVYSSIDAGMVDVPALPMGLLFATFILLTQPAVEAPLLNSEHSPPELPKSWQFSFRTALPPRAPSFIS